MSCPLELGFNELCLSSYHRNVSCHEGHCLFSMVSSGFNELCLSGWFKELCLSVVVSTRSSYSRNGGCCFYEIKLFSESKACVTAMSEVSMSTTMSSYYLAGS